MKDGCGNKKYYAEKLHYNVKINRNNSNNNIYNKNKIFAAK